MGRAANRARVALTAVAALAVVGCGSVYKKDTECPGYLETGNCYDLREAYEASSDFDRDEYRRQLRGEKQPKGGGHPHVESIYHPSQPYMVSDPQPRPILTQAVAVRVFIDPYEDEAGRLHTPGYIFVRAKEPEWIFGGEETQGSRVVTPLVRD